MDNVLQYFVNFFLPLELKTHCVSLGVNSLAALQQQQQRGFPASVAGAAGQQQAVTQAVAASQASQAAQQPTSVGGAQSPSRSLFGTIGNIGGGQPRGILPNLANQIKRGQGGQTTPSSSGILR